MIIADTRILYSTLLRADQIIVLKDGRIEGCGKLEELLENCDELKHIRHGSGDA